MRRNIEDREAKEERERFLRSGTLVATLNALKKRAAKASTKHRKRKPRKFATLKNQDDGSDLIPARAMTLRRAKP